MEDRYRAVPNFLSGGDVISHQRSQLFYRYPESLRSFNLGILDFCCFQRCNGWTALWIHGMF